MLLNIIVWLDLARDSEGQSPWNQLLDHSTLSKVKVWTGIQRWVWGLFDVQFNLEPMNNIKAVQWTFALN